MPGSRTGTRSAASSGPCEEARSRRTPRPAIVPGRRPRYHGDRLETWQRPPDVRQPSYAIITPYYQEDRSLIERCIDSVRAVRCGRAYRGGRWSSRQAWSMAQPCGI